MVDALVAGSGALNPTFAVDLSEQFLLVRSPWGKHRARIHGRMKPDLQDLIRALERPALLARTKSEFFVSKRDRTPRVLQIFGDEVRVQLRFEVDIPYNLESAFRDVVQHKVPAGSATRNRITSALVARQRAREAELSSGIAGELRARLEQEALKRAQGDSDGDRQQGSGGEVRQQPQGADARQGKRARRRKAARR